MTKCICNPGEINLSCIEHGDTGAKAAHEILLSGGNLTHEREKEINKELKGMIKNITRVAEMKARYTVAMSFEDEERGRLYSVWFKAGNQKLCITPMPLSTSEEAEYFREMMAKALDQVVREQV